MLKVFSVEHASSMGPAVMEGGGGGGGGGRRRRGEEQQAFCFVAKQAVEFPQVLTSVLILYLDDIIHCCSD